MLGPVGCALAQPADETVAKSAQREAQLPNEPLSEDVLYGLLLGEIAAQRGDADLAAKTYLELAKRTRDPRVARRAVEMAEFARLPDIALEAARIWHETDPDSPAALQMVTALLVSARRVDEAEPFLEKLLAAKGTNAENGFMQLNRLLAGNPDKQGSLRVVRKLSAAYPDMPQAHFAVSQAAFIAGDDTLALAEIRRASQLKPDWDIAALYEAQILQKKSPDDAARRLSQYLEKYPDKSDVRLNYARLLVADKRYAEARAQFEKLLADNPSNGDVVYAVGLLAFQLRDYATAESSMQRLLKLGYRDPDGVRYLLGQIAEEQRQWAKAVQWYEKVDQGENYLPARIRAAQAMAKQGKVKEARAYLHTIKVNGQEPKVQLIMAEAQILRDAGMAGEALTMLGKALEAQPDQPELLYDMALTADKLDRFDILEANLRKLIKVKPDYAQAYNALGYSLADRNVRLPEARRLIEKALQLAPDDSFIVDSMGWVLYRQGDLKGAASYLRRAYAGRPDAEIGAHLGEVLWVEGEHEEARRIWNEALEIHPDNETLKKTVKRFVR
ncbi:MAG TPA: tetratricopeptide repeat protein [Burkholderiales bacterium]|nr:tetratricopeptide repeat protein [Burkholderiales bacterium]